MLAIFLRVWRDFKNSTALPTFASEMCPLYKTEEKYIYVYTLSSGKVSFVCQVTFAVL